MRSKFHFFLKQLVSSRFNQRFWYSNNGEMQTSIHSIIPDGSDKFFTIDEGYCPTMQNHRVNFDDIIRQTLWYYVENVMPDCTF
jgi:hypothetical protein